MTFAFTRVTGKDAADFLGRLSTADIKKMPPRTVARSAFLTGTAQVIAPADIIRLSSTEFILVTTKDVFPRLEAHLEAMHFSEDLVRASGLAEGAFFFTAEAPAQEHLPIQGAEGETIFFPVEENIGLFWPTGFPGLNCGICLEGGLPAQMTSGYSLASPEDWESIRVAARIPVFGHDWADGARALDVGFLPRIQRTKGCYPGQEVVEKSLNLGHPAKALVVVRLNQGAIGAISSPLSLTRGDRVQGVLTSFASSGRGLAVVAWDARGAGTSLLAQGLEFIVEGV